MNSLKDKAGIPTDATYVILGATGNTGSIIADILLSKGKKVRVVGRDADDCSALWVKARRRSRAT